MVIWFQKPLLRPPDRFRRVRDPNGTIWTTFGPPAGPARPARAGPEKFFGRGSRGSRKKIFPKYFLFKNVILGGHRVHHIFLERVVPAPLLYNVPWQPHLYDFANAPKRKFHRATLPQPFCPFFTGTSENRARRKTPWSTRKMMKKAQINDGTTRA